MFRQLHQGNQDDEHTDDVGKQAQAVYGAGGERVQPAAVEPRELDPPFNLFPLRRQHHLGDDDGCRRTDNGSRQQVPRRIGDDVFEERGIEGEHRARDGRHARGHHDE